MLGHRHYNIPWAQLTRPGKDKTLNDAIYRMVKKLEISTPGDIRLAQVREGGREVEIMDGKLVHMFE